MSIQDGNGVLGGVARTYESLGDELTRVLIEGDLDESSRWVLADMNRRISAMAAIAAATSPQPTAAGTLKDDRALLEGALIAGKLGVPNPTITALFQAGISTIDQLLMLRADLHAGDKYAFRRQGGIGPVGERYILRALDRYDAEHGTEVR